jgi:hypothetical protein
MLGRDLGVDLDCLSRHRDRELLHFGHFSTPRDARKLDLAARRRLPKP